MSSTEIFVGLPEDARSCITNDDAASESSSPAPRPPSPVTQLSPPVVVSPKCSPCLLGVQSEVETNTTLLASSEPDGFKSSRVPNAPKSCIGEIFSADQLDGVPAKNGSSRPRVVRDSPTRPRDTHSRLFGQAVKSSNVAPMITDTIRSNINFAENGKMANGNGKVANGNGHSPPHSPSKMNGSVASSSPSRVSYAPPRRNPVTGDGVPLQPLRRRHPAAGLRGADPDDPLPLLQPQPTHRYVTAEWPPKPANYYVESATKSYPHVRQTPYTLLGLETDDPEINHPVIDPDSLSPQLILDRHWPPFPAQHYLEPKEHKIPHHPLPPYAFVGMTSSLDKRPQPDYKYDPIPTLDGPIDPFLVANTVPPPTLFKYDKDGPIPHFTLLQTPATAGPHTLTGFPPIFHKHVPGYLFNRYRHANDLRPQTYYVDYIRERQMEGNPITGDYKSMNGQINTVTSINGSSLILHNRVPPGGYSSGLW